MLRLLSTNLVIKINIRGKKQSVKALWPPIDSNKKLLVNRIMIIQLYSNHWGISVPLANKFPSNANEGFFSSS